MYNFTSSRSKTLLIDPACIRAYNRSSSSAGQIAVRSGTRSAGAPAAEVHRLPERVLRLLPPVLGARCAQGSPDPQPGDGRGRHGGRAEGGGLQAAVRAALSHFNPDSVNVVHNYPAVLYNRDDFATTTGAVSDLSSGRGDSSPPGKGFAL